MLIISEVNGEYMLLLVVDSKGVSPKVHFPNPTCSKSDSIFSKSENDQNSPTVECPKLILKMNGRGVYEKK
jgi:hypothetical protein